jgi:anti-anti-sigma factor
VPRPPVAITRSDLSGLTWIVLHGELDLAGAGLVGGDLTRICDTHAHVVIDARDVTFIDLAGLRLLGGLERRQHARGARFSLVAGDAVRRLARLGEMRSLLDSERHPDDLLGLAGAHDTGAPPPAAPPSDPVATRVPPPLAVRERVTLRDRVASECARQAALVATMVSLTDKAQAVLDTMRSTSRAAVEGRVRRAGAG